MGPMTLMPWLRMRSRMASRINCPVLVITNSADLACTPSHAARLFAAVGSANKRFVEIKGADHYYTERPDLLPQAVKAVGDWLDHSFHKRSKT